MRPINACLVALRRFSRGRLPAVLGIVSGFVAGCVDTAVPDPVSPVGYCEGLAAIDCKRYWLCTDATSRDGQRPTLLASGIDIGTDLKTCTTNLQAGCAQKPFACAANETFQETKASVCLDSLQRLSCVDLLANGTPPLNCAKVCTSTVMSR